MIINTFGMLCILPVFVKSWMAKLAHLIHLQKLYVASNNVKQPIIFYVSYDFSIAFLFPAIVIEEHVIHHSCVPTYGSDLHERWERI